MNTLILYSRLKNKSNVPCFLKPHLPIFIVWDPIVPGNFLCRLGFLRHAGGLTVLQLKFVSFVLRWTSQGNSFTTFSHSLNDHFDSIIVNSSGIINAPQMRFGLQMQ